MRKTTELSLVRIRIVEEDAFPTRTIDTTGEELPSNSRIKVDPPAFKRLEAWTRRALP